MKLEFLNYSISPKKETAIVFFIIACLGVFLQLDYITEFPSNTHAWAQSDRYAIAKGFVNNNLSLFKPETFIMNHQFPYNWLASTNSSITAVDFPIHDYLVAVIMKITGIELPIVFRLYTLLYSFLGLFFLYKLSKLLTNSFFRSILVLIFAATSPVFVFYQGGFLPSIPSLSNAIIGVFFFVKYLRNNENLYFKLSIFFSTLAALNRTTFVIPLIAVFCLIALQAIRKQTKLKPKIISILLSILTIASYYIYNSYLREQYGSMFLNYIIPPRSLQDFLDVFNTTIALWGEQFFSKIHYFLWLITIIIALLYYYFGKIKGKRGISEIVLYTAIMLSGVLAFALLMFRQFAFHDYYFLDSFFLPILLLFIIALSVIPFTKAIKISSSILTILIAVPLIVNAYNSQKERKTTIWNRTDSTIENFKDTEQILDSLNIPSEAKMLVFTPHVPNIPFILMNRKGYVVFEMKSIVIKKALLWNYDYIIIQNDLLLTDIYPIYPEITSRINKIYDNGKISICKFNPIASYQGLKDFLDLPPPFFQSFVNYESPPLDHWQITEPITNKPFSGNSAGILTKEMEYGLTFKTSNLQKITQKRCILSFQSHFFSKNKIKDCLIVVAIREGDEVTFFQRFPLKDYLDSNNQWEKMELFCQLPRADSENHELSLFIWNTGNESLAIDDVKIQIY